MTAGNSLVGSANDSESPKSSDSKSPSKPKAQPALKRASIGGGLFDDDEDDDDFFSGKTQSKSTPGKSFTFALQLIILTVVLGNHKCFLFVIRAR